MTKIRYKCKQCGVLVSRYRSRARQFCSKACYSEYQRRDRKCSDCGHIRCKYHSALKNNRERRTRTAAERKAHSMAKMFNRIGLKLPLEEARQIIANGVLCPYCVSQVPVNEISLDHIVPLSRGGTNALDNLQWVDLSCNLMKGALSHDEFLTLMRFLKENPNILKIVRSRLLAGGFMYGARRHQKYDFRGDDQPRSTVDVK